MLRSASLMRIGQVSKETGFSVDTIRFYERKGLLAAPTRSDGGFRLYFHPQFLITCDVDIRSLLQRRLWAQPRLP